MHESILASRCSAANCSIVTLAGILPFSERAWDWRMIELFMEKGVRLKHIRDATFVFRLAEYPHLMAGDTVWPDHLSSAVNATLAATLSIDRGAVKSECKFSKQGLTFEKNHMVGALFYHLLQAFSPNTA